MIPSYYEFLNSVKIISGYKALEHIPSELENLGSKRPLIITNDFLVKIGIVKTVIDAFSQCDITIGDIYDSVPPDSSIKVVNEAAKIYREKRCDSIIAVGGGSVIDTAKGLSILITENTDDLMNYMGAEILKKKRSVPFIAVPTTAGTGSEVTLVAVIANPERNVKMEFVSYNLLPDVAILDPRMTKSLPKRMTASTGMDALTHAIEAYTCIQKNPLSDAYAFAAIKIIRDNIIKAVEEGENESVRLAMANASLMAGAAFSNSMVGIVHAIGHACGGVCHVPHGDAMNILLPYCMEYNIDTIGDLYGEILLALSGEEVYSSTVKKERGIKCIEEVKGLQNRLKDLSGLPLRLSEVGVKKEDLPKIADTALNDGALIMNPKEADFNDIMNILNRAY